MGWMGRNGPIRSSRAFRLGVSAVAATLFATLGAAAPAFAAGPPAGHGHHGTSGGGVTVTPVTGSDISFPQCGGAYPSAAFGIVGVNDGRPAALNPCLGPTGGTAATQTELYWAVHVAAYPTTSSPPAAARPSLYVNTADPGDVSGHSPVTDWPTSTPANASNPYPPCSTVTFRYHGQTIAIGADTQGCAWAYGYDKATQDVGMLATAAAGINASVTSTTKVPTAPATYGWWLDVETANTWQSGSTGQAMNVADLSGVVAGLQAAGATVGAYSTSYQWGQITGTTTSTTSVLGQLPQWIPGASSSASAATWCTTAPKFTKGSVALTQWTATYDEDRAC